MHAARGARLLGVQVFLRKVGVRLREPLEVVWKERGAWVTAAGWRWGLSRAPLTLQGVVAHGGAQEAAGRTALQGSRRRPGHRHVLSATWASGKLKDGVWDGRRCRAGGGGGSSIPGTRLAPQGRRVDGWGRAGPRCTRGWVALRAPEGLRGSAPCVPAGLGPVSGGVHRGLGDAQRPRRGALRRAGDGAASRESLRRAGAHCTARLQRRQRSPCLTFGCSLKTHPNKT